LPGGAAETHLERELLPEGVCLRVRLDVRQPPAMLGKSPWLMATSKLQGKSSGNSPHLQGNIDEGKSKKIFAAFQLISTSERKGV
jgi:hypothetical protein